MLLRRDDGRICFVRHLKNGRRYWLLPGGGQEPFETLEDAAVRELDEEIGVAVSGFRFLGLRESFSLEDKRHIQFPILEGINPDFSRLKRSSDPRVEGTDFFGGLEIEQQPLYPSMTDDLIKLSRGESIPLFRTLKWVV